MPSTRRQFLGSSLMGVAVGALASSLGRADPAPPGPPALPERGEIIDFHNHWISPREIEQQRRFEHRPRPYAPAWFDVDARLRHLDEVGVSRQVVSWVGSSYDGVLTPEEARPLWRAHNEDLAALVRRHPSRFSGLASLPTAQPRWAAQELDRAHRELGLIGGTLPLDAFVSLEGARALAPIFEVAQKHRSIIYIHRGAADARIPGQHPEVGATNGYFGLAPSEGLYRPPSAGTPGDDPTARAALITTTHLATGVITVALTDFLDPYPDVTLQFTMLGGSIPFVAEMIGLAARRAGLPDPAERLRRIYVDTGPYSPAVRGVALAVRAWGADRVLFGSDFGPQPSIAPMIEGAARAALSASERDLVFVRNARRLLAERGVA